MQINLLLIDWTKNRLIVSALPFFLSFKSFEVSVIMCVLVALITWAGETDKVIKWLSWSLQTNKDENWNINLFSDFKYNFVRYILKTNATPSNAKKKDVHFGKEWYHISPGQIFSAFQTSNFLPTALKQSHAISNHHWRSPSSMWTRASIHFSLHCAHPA